MTLVSDALMKPGSRGPEATIGWLEVLVGAVLRHSLLGPTDYRNLTLELFRVQALAEVPEQSEVVAVLDWWLVALGHDSRLKLAWQIADHVRDPSVGGELSELLSAHGPGLIRALWRPLQRARVRAGLKSLKESGSSIPTASDAAMEPRWSSRAG